ncbi:MAG TPA: hypothetical protein VET83_05115 [Candidatus Dormibacteraeota bacterium]|nr:hypothetical protein [Candidatus Dormibacteraeota bacterium]
MRFLRWLGIAGLVVTLATSEAAASLNASAKPVRKTPRRAAMVLDNLTHMDANNIDMLVTNHGSFAENLTTQGPGFIYPKGSTKTAVFAAGPWIGAKVNGQVRIAVGEYSQEFVPGPMAGGTFQTDNAKFKNYKIVRGNTTSADYLNWPVDQGAPVDSTGAPALLGDVMLWSVYNDADPTVHINRAGSTEPLGLEVQQSTFGYNRSGALGNIIFVRYKLINKGVNQLDSVYVSAWSDPDLGGATDDLVGCDTTRSLGYVYNATSTDQLYGATPPAVGYDFFRGPIVPSGTPGVNDTLGMTSFNKYINGTDPGSSGETYNYMQGLHADGTPVHVNDDTLQAITRFQVSGNPVPPTSGWLDTSPADRRLMLSSGPFSMAPGDSQEVTIAIIVGQGTSNTSSISDMKNKDDQAQIVFDLNFDIPAPPPSPKVFAQELDKTVRLIWDTAAVGTHSANAVLGQDFVFEGYRVWQLPSRGGFSQAKVIATFDQANSYDNLYSDLFNPVVGGVERLQVVQGPNEGLKFQFDVKTDVFRGGPLVNNRTYYFAVTAYALDTLNVTPFIIGVNQVGEVTEVLESALNVAPATPKGSNNVFSVNGKQISGDFVGSTISVAQVNNAAIGDSLYRVVFLPSGTSWAVINVTTGDTLQVAPGDDTGFTSSILDGFIATVAPAPNDPSLIHQLLGGTGGLLAASDSLNLTGGGVDSTGTIRFTNYISPYDINNFNFDDTVRHDYVLRMLPDTTQFAWKYAAGSPSAESKFKVPWEVYDLGACTYQDPSDDVKMSIMIRDRDGNGKYSYGDAVYIRLIPYASVAWGTPGDSTTAYGNEDQPLGRFTIYTAAGASGPITYPLPGGRFRVRGGRLCAGDTFEFRTVPAGAAPGTIVGNDINKVRAVPNPYYAHSQYELTQFDRVMKFTNIPASRNVTLRIFNLAGDLVRTIRRSASSGDDMTRAEILWDLNTDNRLPVGSGIYIYRIEAEGVGAKTDRIAVFIEKERLDNF